MWKGACDIIQEKEGPIVHCKSPINLYNTKSAFLGFQWVALRKNYVWTEGMKKKMEYLVKTAGGVVAEVIENRMF